MPTKKESKDLAALAAYLTQSEFEAIRSAADMLSHDPTLSLTRRRRLVAQIQEALASAAQRRADFDRAERHKI